MKKRSSFVSLLAVCSSALLVASVVAACGSSKEGSGFNDGDNSDGGGFGDGGKGLGGGGEAGTGGCHGIGCNVVSCPSGGDTTISGTVYAPNGTLPLYNVIVFVPTDPLGSFTDGVSCDTCGKVSGNPVTSTISNPDGTFTLKGVPSGTNVPLVFQVGKWRREVTIPTITSCKDNPITDPNLSRLPKNHTEGDIPHIAMTTGGCDRIACVLPKMGIDASEFGVASDYPAKHVVEYGTDSGSNLAGATSAQSFWQTPAEMAKYDLIVLSCECDEANEDKPPPAQQNMLDYLNAGGRSFGGDYEYTWIHKGVHSSAHDVPAPLNQIQDYGHFYGNPSGGDSDPDGQGPYSIDTSFPKGQALSDWLASPLVAASTTSGKIKLSSVFHANDRIDPTLAQRWVYGSVADKVFSYTTPFTEPDQSKRCGKSYFMDVHVGDASGELVSNTYPKSCGTGALTPQEKMMVFFMMDLASCIQDDKGSVNPPR